MVETFGIVMNEKELADVRAARDKAQNAYKKASGRNRSVWWK